MPAHDIQWYNFNGVYVRAPFLWLFAGSEQYRSREREREAELRRKEFAEAMEERRRQEQREKERIGRERARELAAYAEAKAEREKEAAIARKGEILRAEWKAQDAERAARAAAEREARRRERAAAPERLQFQPSAASPEAMRTAMTKTTTDVYAVVRLTDCEAAAIREDPAGRVVWMGRAADLDRAADLAQRHAAGQVIDAEYEVVRECEDREALALEGTSPEAKVANWRAADAVYREAAHPDGKTSERDLEALAEGRAAAAEVVERDAQARALLTDREMERLERQLAEIDRELQRRQERGGYEM